MSGNIANDAFKGKMNYYVCSCQGVVIHTDTEVSSGPHPISHGLRSQMNSTIPDVTRSEFSTPDKVYMCRS